VGSLTEAEVIALIRPVSTGLKLITFRLEVLLLSLLTCGLFAWACYDPVLTRILAATIFALFALVVIRSTQPTQVSHAEEKLPAE
jgi:hypothetical protein